MYLIFYAVGIILLGTAGLAVFDAMPRVSIDPKVVGIAVTVLAGLFSIFIGTVDLFHRSGIPPYISELTEEDLRRHRDRKKKEPKEET